MKYAQRTMKHLLHVVSIVCCLHALAWAYPGPVTIPSAAPPPPEICRDFISIAETSLPICDFVMADKLRTDLLGLLITDQKNIEILIKKSPANSAEAKRLTALKSHLQQVEQFGVQKTLDICNLKGRVIQQGSFLISGCTYNQFLAIKKTILKIRQNMTFSAAENSWPHLAEQEKFDVFIDDLLLDLAEKNKKDHPDNPEIKTIMLEILKIYGSNGQSLYSAFWGICGLEAISVAEPNSPVDGNVAMNCEEKFLSDLRQVLFLALN